MTDDPAGAEAPAAQVGPELAASSWRAPVGPPRSERDAPATPAAERGASERLRRWQCAGLLALLGLGAFGLGGKPLALHGLLLCGAIALLLLEWLPRAWHGAGPDRFERAWLPLWLTGSLLLALQLVPLPLWLAQALGVVPAALRELSDVRAARLSALPGATLSYWASFSAYWALCLVGARLRRRELLVLALGATALALGEALYGLAAFAAGSDSVFGLWPRGAHLHDATGSFSNRNHFAALLALLWPFGLAALRAAQLTGAAASAAPLVYSLLVGGALCASHSRAGLVAALLGLAAWRLADRGAARGPWAPRALIWAAPVLGLLGAVALGGELALDRFGELLQNTDRLRVWQATLQLPPQVWLLGAGAGSFTDVFKLVHPGDLSGSYPQAHSEYLELLLGFGVLGSAALAACAALWWRAVAPRKHSGLAAGALAGVVAVGAHALVDFHLQLPGVALPFWLLLGIAVNPRAAELALAPGRRRRRSKRRV